MLDTFDYKEPSCALCGGKEFYNPDLDLPSGNIPLRQVIAKLDGAFSKNDMIEAKRLLNYWYAETLALNDKRGRLSILSEQMGLYRKLGEEENGLKCVEEGLSLVSSLNLENTVSGATVILNAATTLKSFGKADKAIPLYEKVSAIYAENLDVFDERKAGLNNNSALAYADVGEYEKAEKLYLTALEILSHGNNLNDVAITYVNLAHLCERMDGKEDKAYEYVEKAIEVLDNPSIEQNGYHAYVCSKCAPSVGYFGYFIAEERLSSRSKEIYERT